MGLVDLNGQPIGTASNKGKITQAQAGAIVTSEIDMAILNWNTAATQAMADDATRADLFHMELVKHEYTPEAKEKSGLFGYAELVLSHKKNGVRTKVYNKGQNFKKESDMNNLNGYYPALIFDCIGFLIASGLMYNLALIQSQDENKEGAPAEILQSGGDSKDES